MKLKNTILWLLTLILFSACSGNNLEQDFLNSGNENPGTVEILALQHLANGEALELDEAGAKVFTNDLGFEVTLNEAMIHFHELRLNSDGEDPTCVGGNDQTINLHASHDLMLPDLMTQTLSSAQIPYVYYCSWEVELGADDSHGTAETFHLAGSWSQGGAMGAFELVGSDLLTLGANFMTEESGEIIEHPLHIHETETQLSILFATRYDLLFEGVDFEATEEEQIAQISANFEHAFHQHTGEHGGSVMDHGDDGHDH